MCKDFDLIYLKSENLKRIYNSKNFLLMDAYDNKLGIFEEKKFIRTLFFSIDENCISEQVLLFFGSEDNRFITNRAYDLIFFLSKIIEQKIKRNLVKNQLKNYLKEWIEWIENERRLSKQTVKAYKTDLKFFLDHQRRYKIK